METLDKLIVEENYLPGQIFYMDETSLFWRRIPERSFVHEQAKSVPGFKVRVSTLYDVRKTMKSPNDFISQNVSSSLSDAWLYRRDSRTMKVSEILQLVLLPTESIP
jgi:hypothetical protein